MEDRPGNRRIEATVPGCVHLDLIRAGVIEDPDIGDAELRQMWVGRTEWICATTFDVPAEFLRRERIELVLDEVDGTGEAWLNGSSLGVMESRWFPHRFEVSRTGTGTGTRTDHSSRRRQQPGRALSRAGHRGGTPRARAW